MFIRTKSLFSSHPCSIHQRDGSDKVLYVQWMLIVCCIYYSVFPNFFAQGLEIAFVSPLKHSSTCLTFQFFFLLFFFFVFLGWKWEGCRLPLQLQNQQERFQMPFGSHILASCHVLYDISIFTVLPEWERLKEKQRKTGAILARQQWAAATCGSDSFCGVMGYMRLHYNG